MYRCVECNDIFDEPDKYVGECLEYFGVACRERLMGCPSCGGAYIEALKCGCCGEYIIGKYIETEDEQRFCECCYRIKDASRD